MHVPATAALLNVNLCYRQVLLEHPDGYRMGISASVSRHISISHSPYSTYTDTSPVAMRKLVRTKRLRMTSAPKRKEETGWDWDNIQKTFSGKL